MIIKRVHIKNFRCIEEASIEIDPLTILIGKNGSGKSSVLKALEIFYQPNADYNEEDFYNRDTSRQIEITVYFGDLNESELHLFGSHVDGDTLAVTKILTWPRGRGTPKYYGRTRRNPDFQSVRTATRVTEKRREYQELKATENYSDLPDLPGNASQKDIENALIQWEGEHPEQLQWIQDEGQFFGFKEVGEARLERFTRYILIPAVRDASQDALERRGAIISELMDLVVRKVLANREDIQKLQEETQMKYREIVDPDRLEELQGLQGKMTKTIQTFAPGTEVILSWQSGDDIQIPMPKALVKLREHGFDSAVERAGHGTQRAFILTMLQQLAIAESAETQAEGVTEDPAPFPNIIIGIEEPELYQHPARVRHLAKVFAQLTSHGVPGVGQFQIICTTHSPLLVDLERFDQIRLLRRVDAAENQPKHAKVHHARMQNVTSIIEKAETGSDGKYNPEGTRARLRTLMTPWTNEGFFADAVVLVEGEEDRAAILAVAEDMGRSLDSMGIAVIPCRGKTNLLKLAAVFKAFSLPLFVVWDSDEGKEDSKVDCNRALLRFFGQEEEDYPDRIDRNFACFRTDMTSVIKQEAGEELYNKLMERLAEEQGYGKVALARKNPHIVQEFLRRARKAGKECTSLKKIVNAICQMGSG